MCKILRAAPGTEHAHSEAIVILMPPEQSTLPPPSQRPSLGDASSSPPSPPPPASPLNCSQSEHLKCGNHCVPRRFPGRAHLSGPLRPVPFGPEPPWGLPPPGGSRHFRLLRLCLSHPLSKGQLPVALLWSSHRASSPQDAPRIHAPAELPQHAPPAPNTLGPLHSLWHESHRD